MARERKLIAIIKVNKWGPTDCMASRDGLSVEIQIALHPILSELDTLLALPMHHLFITFHLRHGIFPVSQTEATRIQLLKVTFDLNVTHCLGYQAPSSFATATGQMGNAVPLAL